VPRDKLFGIFRGVDGTLFNSKVTGKRVRDRLQLQGKFVIGYFGHFDKFRLINEVVIPLIKRTREKIPEAYFLIAGRGEPALEAHFRMLSKSRSELMLLLDFVPPEDVPEYLAACDVTISPLDSKFKHSQNSAPLKVVESIALGRPIVATRTKSTHTDFADLKGVIWVGTDFQEFLDALTRVAEDYPYYSSQAARQAQDMEKYRPETTTRKITDHIVKVCAA
jgi:glycosyltransferase involved in cell wall biosynthesis